MALVETALVVPFLILLSMGIWEFSNGWQSNLAIQSSVRASARTGSSLGRDRTADYAMLLALRSGLTDFSASDIQRVVIFKANTVDTPATACKNGTPSTANSCNVYTGAQVNTISLSAFTGTTSCTLSSPDRFWCPVGSTSTTGRNVSQADADYVGVWVRVLSPYQSGFFPGSGITIEKTMIMRLEPKVTP